MKKTPAPPNGRRDVEEKDKSPLEQRLHGIAPEERLCSMRAKKEREDSEDTG